MSDVQRLPDSSHATSGDRLQGRGWHQGPLLDPAREVKQVDAFQKFQYDQQRDLERAMREEAARKQAEAAAAADRAAKDRADRAATDFARYAQSHHTQAQNLRGNR